MTTHGLGRREEERRPAQIAQRAERFSSHSVWCSDHILNQTTRDSYTHAATCNCPIVAMFSIAAVTSDS
jgi:alkanesulfonate monooxygenase SsuD/methylene tetrahydromethanopterin reductase-like flavin-dependent oxidoreductase (luciferase family)